MSFCFTREELGWLSFSSASHCKFSSSNETDNFLDHTEMWITLSYWPLWLHTFGVSSVPQTMGISFNCISHWHLTWFIKRHRSSFASLFCVNRQSLNKKILHTEVNEQKSVYLSQSCYMIMNVTFKHEINFLKQTETLRMHQPVFYIIVFISSVHTNKPTGILWPSTAYFSSVYFTAPFHSSFYFFHFIF